MPSVNLNIRWRKPQKRQFKSDNLYICLDLSAAFLRNLRIDVKVFWFLRFFDKNDTIVCLNRIYILKQDYANY